MVLPNASEPTPTVLLHRNTGTAHYTTRATETERQRANRLLQRAGSDFRFVAARHLMVHGEGGA